MKWKSVTLGAIALTAAFLLSACSGSGAAKTAAESSKAETVAETTAAETQSEAPTYGDSGSEVLRLAKDSNSPEARKELEKLLAKNDCIQYLSKGCFAADTRFARGGDQFNRVEFYGKGKDRYCKYTIPDRDVTYEWFDGENMYHYQEKDERPSAFLFTDEDEFHRMGVIFTLRISRSRSLPLMKKTSAAETLPIRQELFLSGTLSLETPSTTRSTFFHWSPGATLPTM